MLYDNAFMQNDILGLTKTKLENREDTSIYESAFEGVFSIVFNCNEKSYKSLGFCYEWNLLMNDTFSSISIVKVKMPKFSEHAVTLALADRPPSTPVIQ